MSGFDDPILTGDGSLIREAEKSPDYVPGVSGWSINKDGSAEFNDATIRGQLIASLLATRLTGRRIVIDGTGPNYDQITFYSGSVNEVTPGSVKVNESPTLLDLTILSPKINGAGVASRFVLRSDSIFGGFVDLFSGGDMTLSANGTLTIRGGADGTGDLLLDAGDLIRVAEGTAIKRGDLATPSLLNGWTNRPGGYAPAQYVELPDHTGMLSGAISPGTLTGGTVLFTLPSQMRPSAAHSFMCPGSAGGSAMVQVEANGNVTIWNATAGVTWVALSGCIWPIAGF